MFCKNCGKDLGESLKKFCPECGAEIVLPATVMQTIAAASATKEAKAENSKSKFSVKGIILVVVLVAACFGLYQYFCNPVIKNTREIQGSWKSEWGDLSVSFMFQDEGQLLIGPSKISIDKILSYEIIDDSVIQLRETANPQYIIKIYYDLEGDKLTLYYENIRLDLVRYEQVIY